MAGPKLGDFVRQLGFQSGVIGLGGAGSGLGPRLGDVLDCTDHFFR
jgi:hypothetical protein